MELAKLIEKLEVGPTSEKTASDAPSTETNLKTALTDSLAGIAPATEKVASAETDAVESLKKIASDLAGTDKQAEVAQVTALASAFADTVLNKFAAYDAALPQVNEDPSELVDALKTAAAQGYSDTAQALQGGEGDPLMELEKAAAAGDPEAYAVLEKYAAEQFDAGQNQALADVQAQAASEFVKGAQEISVLIQHLETQG